MNFSKDPIQCIKKFLIMVKHPISDCIGLDLSCLYPLYKTLEQTVSKATKLNWKSTPCFQTYQRYTRDLQRKLLRIINNKQWVVSTVLSFNYRLAYFWIVHRANQFNYQCQWSLLGKGLTLLIVNKITVITGYYYHVLNVLVINY